MLRINNLHLNIAQQEILRDISLTIKQGETYALVGESGSGKTVLAQSILRLLEHNHTIEYQGNINFRERNLLTMNDEEMRSIRGKEISMIFQEPMSFLNPVYTIGSQLVEPLLLHRKLTKKDATNEASKLLDRCGIEEAKAKLQRYPHELSGGQRQRAMIAMALAGNPKLLIADEPTTALDVTIQAQILQLLHDLQEEINMSILLITHDLPLVKYFAEKVSIMKEGQVIETGPVDKIFNNPKSSYTKHLIHSVPKEKDTKRPGASSVLLKVDNLNLSLPVKTPFLKAITGRRTYQLIVDNVSFALEKGMTCGIIGESGSGKTSLALSLIKLLNATGEIVFDTTPINQLSRSQLKPIRREIQIVFQDPFASLSPRLNVGQIIMEGMIIHKVGENKRERKKLVLEILKEVGMDEPSILHRYPNEFSGGQRQRIAIARSLVLHPKLLILDEPTSALDTTIQAQIINLLKHLQEKHKLSYIFISHDLRVIRSMADHILVMKSGKIVEQGSASTLFQSPRHPYTKNLFNAALT